MKQQRLITLICIATFSLSFLVISCNKSSDNIEHQELSQDLTDEITTSSLTGSNNHFDLVIGAIQNGTNVITADIDDVKNAWINAMQPAFQTSLQLDEISIDSEGSQYFLTGKDLANKATSRISLVLDGGNFYEMAFDGGGQTVTCTGCTSTGPGSGDDCVPKDTNTNSPWCTSCSVGSDKCTKTVTKSSVQIIDIGGADQ